MVPTIQPDQELIAVGEGAFAVPQAHRSAVLEGLGEAERGECVSDEEIAARWKKCGVKRL
ncbi:hypothetical protein [Bradyrhizobium sp. JYMT SZCCT0180]|uniref:hypothetical protein n=1 Tax=Bradyrhizobium sp. JYMT SZCCT0180 TaxID=2807666 RepID=UPI001BA792FA|nr:hypothetical protein [Bradyrhizobium sp. JYMT SZCCT0180]MBR1214369.1 hypothetical protein [Bradyrhizobium sp. JYMT SZCCT0180]